MYVAQLKYAKHHLFTSMLLDINRQLDIAINFIFFLIQNKIQIT